MKDHEFYGIVLFVLAVVFWVSLQECENSEFRNRIEKLENKHKCECINQEGLNEKQREHDIEYHP